jgi:RNA polymerase sigma factor (sigma-70 family)
MTDDAELLRQYVQAGSEDAFAELVERHLPVVYSSALRQTYGDLELARDICQTVFIDLAGKARSLLGHELLIGWLFSATRFAAAAALRGNRRRQIRERIAVSMHEDAATPALEYRDPELASALDAAIEDLASEDRNAVLLRFFQGKDFKDVGTALGISEDAARMRVTRATGKLHSLLASRGVTVSAAALGSILATEAVTAVPAGLAATISTAALAGIPLAATATATITEAIAMTTLQKTLVTAAVAVLAGVGIYEARQAAKARAEVQTLQQQQAPKTEHLQRLKGELQDATNRLAAMAREIARNKSELRSTQAPKPSESQVSALNAAKLAAFEQVSRSMYEAEHGLAVQGGLSQLRQHFHLTPEQETSIREILNRDPMPRLGGHKTEVEAFLSSDQKADYAQFWQETRHNASRIEAAQAAMDVLSNLQPNLGLNQEQQDKAFSALVEFGAQRYLDDGTKNPSHDFSLTAAEDMYRFAVNGLKGVLTDEQMAVYEEYEEQVLKVRRSQVSSDMK